MSNTLIDFVNSHPVITFFILVLNILLITLIYSILMDRKKIKWCKQETKLRNIFFQGSVKGVRNCINQQVNIKNIVLIAE